MRHFLLALTLLSPGYLGAQSTTAPSPVAAAPAQIGSDLRTALLGEWVGFLEYRDYSEPVTSLKRVQLPTWFSIRTQPEGLRFHYIYDDGPTKIVESDDTVVIDTAAATYKVIATDKAAHSYAIAGLDRLRQGRGELVLTGTGTDNGKPADQRITLTIRRNMLLMLEEARPTGTTEPFAFRHKYVFTRAVAPKPAPTR